MMAKKISLSKTLLKIALASLIFSETAYAQWIFAARHIEGRINLMTQNDSSGAPAVQLATVIINAPASKVYATAVNVASQNPALTITSQDPRSFKLSVSEGTKSASINVVVLSEQTSEIMISATAAPQGQDPSTSVATNTIFKICNQLNKVCKLGAN